MSGRKRKLPSSFVPEPCVSEDEDGQWVGSEHLRHVPSVPLHILRNQQQQQHHRHPNPNQQEQQREAHDNDLENDVPVHGSEEEDNQEQQIGRVHNEGDECSSETTEMEIEIDIDTEDENLLQDDDGEQGLNLEQIQEPVDGEDGEDEDEDQGEDEDQDEDQDEDEEPVVIEGTFQDLYEELSNEWLVTEVDHHVSKSASNAFWKLSNKYFHRVYLAKEREGRTKKIPQFKQVRETLYAKKVPPISVEVAYKNNTTGEVVVEKGTTTPTSQYPPNLYCKLYEMATVKVMMILI